MRATVSSIATLGSGRGTPERRSWYLENNLWEGRMEERSLEDRIIEEACRHPDFRARLLASPKEAIEKRFGFTLPNDIKIDVFVRSSNEHVVLVLPPSMREDFNAQPTEADLLTLSAGFSALLCSTTVPGGTCWNTPNCPTRKGCP